MLNAFVDTESVAEIVFGFGVALVAELPVWSGVEVRKEAVGLFGVIGYFSDVGFGAKW